ISLGNFYRLSKYIIHIILVFLFKELYKKLPELFAVVQQKENINKRKQVVTAKGVQTVYKTDDLFPHIPCGFVLLFSNILGANGCFFINVVFQFFNLRHYFLSCFIPVGHKTLYLYRYKRYKPHTYQKQQNGIDKR